MSAKAKSIPTAFTFQVSKNDLGPLFVDSLKLEWNNFSPLAGLLSSYVVGSNSPSDELAEISQSSQVLKAASILANPVLRMVNRTGGGAMPVSHFTACCNPDIDGQAFAVVTPSFEGSYLVQLFDSPWHYLGWWLILNATEADKTTGNYMPPPIRFESLVYMLHAIDAYRRIAFESMLDYTPTEKPLIRPTEFTDSMLQSIRSRDLRWLLPAFISLTPNLNVSSFDNSPEFISALAQFDFLLPARDAETQEDVFVFGEAGKIMGVEFHRAWMKSVGFETTVLTSQGWRVMHRGFLAPTGFTNHLFLLEMDTNGNCIVNHQAMSRRMLDYKLANLLASALDLKEDTETGLPLEEAVPITREPSTVAPLPSIPTTAETGIVCPSCGKMNAEDARFCNGCATTLQPSTTSPLPPKETAIVTPPSATTKKTTSKAVPDKTAIKSSPQKKQLEAIQRDIKTYKWELGKLEVKYKVGELPLEKYQSSDRELRSRIEQLEVQLAELTGAAESQSVADTVTTIPEPPIIPPPSPVAAGPTSCPKCGAPLKTGKKFCNKCGHRI